jgi:hypothetical protein
VPPTCVQLPQLVRTEGRYRVTKAAAQAVGLPTLPDLASIPVRVSYVPLVETTLLEAVPQGLPLDSVSTSSRLFRRTNDILYAHTVAVGTYRRIAYPEPPYDELFPPVISTLQVIEPAPGAPFPDDFVLDVGTSKSSLDDETGESRRATVKREEGLDGWRIWLADAPTGRRISVIRTLAGTRMEVKLHTVGQSQAGSRALRDDVDVVVAPPEGWLGVPLLQSSLLAGAGLDLTLPSLPAAASVTGVVASGEGAALTAVPARLLFTSSRLRLSNGTLQPLLHYTTAVSTDDTGKFATVLPPGLYDVTIEPAEGTGFAKVKDTFDTADTLGKTFRPPPRTVANGRVMLADRRPLAEAEILAIPSERAVAAGGTAVKPRPARTRTDREGAFSFEVDNGQYDLVVEPQAGTGFARLVQLRSFGTGTAPVGEIVVAPPARVSFVLRDPSLNGNPIVRAMVRIFVDPMRGPPAVEVGRGMTDENGKCEILLAQQAR